MQIDFHTHVLPDVDDGSQSVKESLDMLDALCAQGVDLAVATPHFYSNKTSLDAFLERRNKAFDLLCAAREERKPKLLSGAEVRFFRGIGEADRLAELCIADTNVLLLEMPFAQWGRGEIAELHRVLDRGITPVIAHIERYISFQKDLAPFNEIINLPVFAQVNAEALLQRRTRKFVLRLIDHGFSVLLGTDCHNMKRRRPDMDAGREVLLRKFGPDCLEKIDTLGAQLLKINE